MGFTGWGYAPPFHEQAKDLLCDNPKGFFASYGDHYVYGTRKGALIRVETTMQSNKEEVSHSTSASISAAYEGFGVSASASAGFEEAASHSSDISSTRTKVHMEGQDLGYALE